jgi:hypothetical protein
MKEVDAHSSWLQILNAARNQVKRAKDAPRENLYGECGLALVGITAMLEAYLNLHVKKEIIGRGASVADLYENINGTPAKYKYLPRVFGCPKELLEEYESNPVHREIKGLFTLRNKYVHGDVHKWKLVRLSKKQITKKWGDALDVVVLLETKGRFRIPDWMHDEFIAEVNGMRIG